MGHVCILAAKYWKTPGVEDPWFLWKTYSLHCTLGDVSFSVFESVFMYLCIWVPNPPLILHLSLLITEKSLEYHLHYFPSNEFEAVFQRKHWAHKCLHFFSTLVCSWSSCSPSLDHFEDVPSCSICSAAPPGLCRVGRKTYLTFCSVGTAASVLSHN